ncbi:hypothetical protein CNL05845 [Cryptococcus deneoformans JEC21]|uniref:Thioredoxin domain-containing protein n=1 Tax=Cryptococcus deneoformans (strain JEC21 / ATCC MYA-565) TaxID=214684 RepID=A0A0S2M6B1_CRYD1|nr:hypothetical protein CNL05845 [Cryptococcus neoformans var. neoformans JEC21]ALO69700.1 hypothetical protein CNL05845 [Cryptococcus neoformans var. neoformans JEC21]
MPITETTYPPSPSTIDSSGSPTFLIFYSDAQDGRMWCSHCRDVEGVVKSAFQGGSKPRGIITYIGNYTQWKTPSHPARSAYGVKSVPTIIKLENGKETGRATKMEILNSSKFEEFLGV